MEEITKQITELRRVIDVIEDADLEHYQYCDALKCLKYELMTLLEAKNKAEQV